MTQCLLPPNDTKYDPYLCMFENVDLLGKCRDWTFEYDRFQLTLCNNGGASWKIGTINPDNLVSITGCVVGKLLFIGLNFDNQHASLLTYDLETNELSPIANAPELSKVSFCFNRALNFDYPILTALDINHQHLERYVVGKDQRFDLFESTKGNYFGRSLGRTGLNTKNQLITETFVVRGGEM